METNVPDLQCLPKLRRSERIIKLTKRKIIDKSVDTKIKIGPPPKLTVHDTTAREVSICSTDENPAVAKIKREARKLFTEKKYDLALEKYTLLIEMCPDGAIHYSNRSACYMMLENFSRGLDDARKSIELHPTLIQGHRRVMRCALKLHEFNDIDSSAAKLKEIDPDNDVLQDVAQQKQYLFMHLANECRAIEAKDYEKALEHIEQCLTICPQFLEYKAKKAKYLAKICNFSEAEALASAILEQDSNSSDAHYALGRCLYERDTDKSFHHFDEAFRLNENCDREWEFYEFAKDFLEKKTEGNNAYKARNFTQAHDLYQGLLKRGGLNKVMKVTLISNMSQASYRLGKIDQCLDECGKVLNLNPDHWKTLIRRAQCRMDLKDYEKAIEDLQTASNIESSNDILKKLKEAQRLLKAAKNDFHGILGVAKDTSWQVVDKAYKKLTLEHHPDRHANATMEDREFHEKKCKEITRAYRLLKEEYEIKLSSCSDNSNGYKSSSNGTNNNSNGSKTSSEDSNNCNRQKPSSNGPKTPPPRTSSKSNEQKSSSGRTNNSPNGKKSPAKGFSPNTRSSKSNNNNDDKQSSSKGSGNDSNEEESDEDSVWARKQRWRGSRWNGKGKYRRSYCYTCGERVLDPDDPECSCTMDRW